MLGGDFYFPEKQRWFKKQVIKKIRHFVTYLKGEFELVKKWYGAKGTYHESFMYPSNLYKEYNIKFIHVKAHQPEPINKTSPKYRLWLGNHMADKFATTLNKALEILPESEKITKKLS